MFEGENSGEGKQNNQENQGSEFRFGKGFEIPELFQWVEEELQEAEEALNASDEEIASLDYTGKRIFFLHPARNLVLKYKSLSQQFQERYETFNETDRAAYALKIQELKPVIDTLTTKLFERAEKLQE